MARQDDVFREFEGDNWFKRNRDALDRFDPEVDLPLRIIELYKVPCRSVLEIGAANGFRLAAIAERYGARVVAVECSLEAISDGEKKFKQVQFVRGVAHNIPIDCVFDLVIVNFVFHWIDRSNLLRSVAEVDRLVRDGGHLILGDFFPSNLLKVPYHHLSSSEVYTYKQDYARIFVASGLYQPACLLTTAHSVHTLTTEVSENERVAVWLLKKQLQENYSHRNHRVG